MMLENQFIYPYPPVGDELIDFFRSLGVGVIEEPTTWSGGARRSQNQWGSKHRFFFLYDLYKIKLTN
jgi:hypothetical protein